MKKFVVYASLIFLATLFSCNNTVQLQLKGVSVLGQYQDISANTCHIALKDCDNIKASDVKVHFTDGSIQNVKMTPSFVLVRENEEVSFDITNIDGLEPKFNIKVFVKLLKEEQFHGGDIRIWVPISSKDKNEAKEAIPDNAHINDYIFEVPYNFEEYDLPQIWVLYNKEPNAKVKSDNLVFYSKADGKEPLLLYYSFPSQGKTLTIPIYIATSEGAKVYNLHIKTSIAPENQNASIKSIKFNEFDGIIEGKNITCSSSFSVGSTINVVPTLENNRASCSINGNESVVIKEEGVSFTIVVTPEKTDGIRKIYSVFLEAPPNDEIKRLKVLNYDSNSTLIPSIADLVDVEVQKEENEKYVVIPLYTVAENVAINFETTLEIANVFFMKKNRWTRLDSYSSSKKILTLREGVLPLPPSLSTEMRLKVLFKSKSYDTITIKFKKPDHLKAVSLMGLYVNDVEIENTNIQSYFDGSIPLFSAKGAKITVDIVSKEALHTTIEGKSYKSIYSGFLSYGLSIPITMPKVNEEKNIDIILECDYARSLHLQFRVKRIAGAVDLALYPSINGYAVGTDTLEKINNGENPVISVSGEVVLFSVDTKDDCIKTMKVNEELATRKTLIDSQTNEEFYRFEFLIRQLNIGQVKDVKVQIEPKDLAEYNNLEWRFKVRREV